MLNSRCCNQLNLSTLTSKKLTAVLPTANSSAPAPKAAVPPSVRQARRRLTTNPQRKRAVVKRRERVELQMLRTMVPYWTVRDEEERAVKVTAEEVIARGPV